MANCIGKISTLKKNIILSVIVTLLFFLFVEGLLRLIEFSPRLSRNEFKLLHGRLLTSTGFESGIYTRDSLLFWRFRPSQKFIVLDNVPIEYIINSKGLREREFSTVPRDDTVRIICMGNSSTFGFGVKYEDIYSQVLEKRLNSGSLSKRFEVINAGVPGYSSLQGLRFLREEISRYQPDLITICYGQNDFDWPFSVSKVDKEIKLRLFGIVRLKNFLGNFELYQLLENITVTIRAKLDKSRQISSGSYHAQRVLPEDMVDNLTKMIEIARDKGIMVFLMTIPGGRATDVVKTTAEINAVPFIDVSILTDEGKEAILLDRCHPNPKGSKVIAEAIHDKLWAEIILD